MEDSEDDWETDSGEEVEAEEATTCLFSSKTFPSVAAALDHDAAHAGFDLREYVRQARLDEYGAIKCINYIRAAVKGSRDPRPDLAGALSRAQKPWDEERFLFPELQDDSLLCHEWDNSTPAAEDTRMERAAAGEAAGPSHITGDDELQRLRQENAALRTALQQVALGGIPDEELREMEGGLGMERMALGSTPSGARQQPQQVHVRPGAEGTPSHKALARAAHIERADEGYFDSYGYFDIHRTMLADKVRTDAYQRAIEGNPGLLRGATVLDVGAGTGILSMFSARAGAACVFAVEGSKRMAEFAQRIVAENGLDSAHSGPISVLPGRIEDLESLPVPQVDVIVSEWMGYALLFESMLDSVLYARDRWLRPGGALLPDFATLFVAAADASAVDLGFWERVYGFSYAPVAAELHEAAQRTAHVGPVDGGALLTAACPVRYFDLAAMSAADADFTADFTLHATPSASGAPAEVHALVLWFDAEFSGRHCRAAPALLTTSPHAPQTHWAQTVLALRTPVLLQGGQAQQAAKNGSAAAASLRGRLSLARSNIHRCLDISVECCGCDAEGAPVGLKQAQLYSIATQGS